MKNKILDTVNDYYTEKIKEHGVTPRGVDWNSTESQELRFSQLSRVFEASLEDISILDYGSGYGAYYAYLKKKGRPFHYTGFDISQEMVNQGAAHNGTADNLSWCTEINDNQLFDYTIASGIFNVRLQHNDEEWKKYIGDVILNMNKISRKGFSFNMLTSYSDKEFMRDYLYYANPGVMFDFCKTNCSKHVALLHDYPLYEFTILVKKL